MKHKYKTKVFLQHLDELDSDFEKRINEELEELCENCDGIQYTFNDDNTFCFTFSYPIIEETMSKKEIGFTKGN